MGGHLGEIFWQILVVGLIFLALMMAIWIARRYSRWLRQRSGNTPKWLLLSTWGVGTVAFLFLAVLFGFVMDRSGGP